MIFKRRPGYSRFYVARKTIRMIILNKILIAKQYICPVKPVDTFEEGCAIELAEAIEASRKMLFEAALERTRERHAETIKKLADK